ncbi:hypothetical protein [Streptomyces olivaceus]|uniref:hypothetical protein n=1 Tax=Streptomyces olivaceus TaxID=47716 RepID=UPI001D17BCBC|nr:hypothetical protein [Streptomyces olivaceus]
MDERHLLNELMKVVAAEAHEFVVRSRIPGLKKFAASAYVAEFFWYRYTGHAPGSAALNNPYHSTQRPLPASRCRACGRNSVMCEVLAADFFSSS